jgi:hypothetical protein
VTFELVLQHLRRRHFAVLSTISRESAPHSVGVTYRVSRPGRDVVIYVMTRRHLHKARNIAENPHVSVVVPLTRRLLWFLPPPVIQLHGQAEILDWTDEEGTVVFRHFWMGRRILEAYRESHRRGETRICFLKITPDPMISTYMVGSSVRELRNRIESGAAQVVIPPEYRRSAPPSRSEVRAPPAPEPDSMKQVLMRHGSSSGSPLGRSDLRVYGRGRSLAGRRAGPRARGATKSRTAARPSGVRFSRRKAASPAWRKCVMAALGRLTGRA